MFQSVDTFLLSCNRGEDLKKQTMLPELFCPRERGATLSYKHNQSRITMCPPCFVFESFLRLLPLTTIFFQNKQRIATRVFKRVESTW